MCTLCAKVYELQGGGGGGAALVVAAAAAAIVAAVVVVAVLMGYFNCTNIKNFKLFFNTNDIANFVGSVALHFNQGKNHMLSENNRNAVSPSLALNILGITSLYYYIQIPTSPGSAKTNLGFLISCRL